MDVLKKTFTKINSISLPIWLIVVLTLALVLRIPSFFEPYTYGDEMIYLTLGQGIRQGIPLYSGIYDNKPPLLYLLAALANNLFWFKVILAFWSSLTVVIFWKLATRLYPKRINLQVIATVVFTLFTTIPLLEGNIANAEMFMIGPTMFGFYCLLKDKVGNLKLITAGGFFSLAALFKVPAAFDLFAIIFLWLIMAPIKTVNIKKTVLKTTYLLLGFFIPIGLTLLFFALKGSVKDYVSAAFLQNIGYLSSWKAAGVAVPFWIKNQSLLIRASVLILGLIFLFLKRKVLPKEFIFITAWLLFSLFGVTLSGRPYPHYLIQAVPPIALLSGILFTDKSIIQSIAALPLTLAFFIPIYFNFWHYPTLSYYQNFLKFTFGQINKNEYFSYFNDNALRNYEISNLIMNLTDKRDRVFVWGDDAKIYALSKRLPPTKFIADYHIKDYSSNEEVFKAINDHPPKIIVYLPEAPCFPTLKSLLKKGYIYLANIKGAEIYKLIDPKVQSIIAPEAF